MQMPQTPDNVVSPHAEILAAAQNDPRLRAEIRSEIADVMSHLDPELPPRVVRGVVSIAQMELGVSLHPSGKDDRATLPVDRTAIIERGVLGLKGLVPTHLQVVDTVKALVIQSLTKPDEAEQATPYKAKKVVMTVAPSPAVTSAPDVGIDMNPPASIVPSRPGGLAPTLSHVEPPVAPVIRTPLPQEARYTVFRGAAEIVDDVSSVGTEQVPPAVFSFAETGVSLPHEITTMPSSADGQTPFIDQLRELSDVTVPVDRFLSTPTVDRAASTSSVVSSDPAGIIEAARKYSGTAVTSGLVMQEKQAAAALAAALIEAGQPRREVVRQTEKFLSGLPQADYEQPDWARRTAHKLTLRTSGILANIKLDGDQ